MENKKIPIDQESFKKQLSLNGQGKKKEEEKN